MEKVPTKAGPVVQLWEMTEKEVMQKVFMYGSDRWVVMGETLTVLESFNNRVERRIARKTYQHDGDGGWEWTTVEESLEVERLWSNKEYIQRRQAIIVVHISNRPIYELCTGEENVLGYRR